MSSRDRQYGGLYPPAPKSVIAEAEQKLGFRLPPLLREIYANLANRGFGPGYGLLGLAGGYTVEDLSDLSVVEYYLYVRSLGDDLPWPAQLVAVCYFGCGGTYAVDCSKPDYPVIATDLGDLEPASRTFNELMERWANGTNELLSGAE